MRRPPSITSRRIARSCAVAALLVAGAASGAAPLAGSGAAPGTAANPVKAKAAARGGYLPARLVVTPGRRVWFVSADHLPHTATSYKRVRGKPVFDNLPSAGLFSIRAPRAAGTYRYFCLVHPYQRGVLVVRAPARRR